MAFHAVPVTQSEGDVAAAEWKRVGFGIMDRFFQANDKEKIPVDEFLDFLLDKVVLNIVNDPDDPKYRKLKKSSKALGAFQGVKRRTDLLDYLGFREKVVQFELYYVLGTMHDDWLDEFKDKASLIRNAFKKRKQSLEKEESTAAAKAKADAEYKERVRIRILEERAERGSTNSK